MRKPVLLLAAAVGISSAYVQAYSVTPIKAAWSGWTSRGDTVSQTLTCNFDSLAYVELFVGDHNGSEAYNLLVVTYPGGAPVASQDGGSYLRPCHWVRFDRISVTHPQRIVKGTLLEFRFTRSGSDSINYFWQDGDPYRYGDIVVGSEPIPGRDLCLRVYGTLNPVPPAFWGMDKWNFIPSVSAA